MKNKIGKWFVFAILGFLASTISVHALSYDITDPNSFSAMMDKYDSTTQSIYVIGSYVFTTKHTLTTQDMMLAALSIDLTDAEGDRIKDSEAYNKMTIFKLERDYDEETDEPTGTWTVVNNYVGSDSLKENKLVDVTYVDYEKVQGESSLSVTFDASQDMIDDLTPWGYHVVLENQKNITVTPSEEDPTVVKLGGKVYYLPEIDNWEEDKQTGYYLAFEVKIPEEYKGKAQWWLSEDNKLTHDGRNYAVYSLSKDASEKSFEVWVDFDGDGEEYEATSYVFDYSDIEFVAQASKAKISASTTDSEVLNVYKDALHIFPEDFVTITNDNKITGDIHYNPDVAVDPTKDSKTNYYIPVIVEIDKEYAGKATITTTNNGEPKSTTFQASADNADKNMMALLFTVSKTDTDKTFTITIDLDGAEGNFEPVDYVFDYTDANFLEVPTASVSAEGATENQAKYASIIEEQFNFEGNQKTLTVDVKDNKVTLTGELVNKSYPFNGKSNEDVDGYYFQYVIEISGDAKDSSITIPAEPGEAKVIKYADYDFKDENGKSGIVVLHKLNETKEDKTFTVTVDLDGDGDADETYTFDYSQVVLGEESKVTVVSESSKIPAGDKTSYEEWGFPGTGYDLITIKDNVISGTIPYVEHISTDAFTGVDVTGNYMVYAIELPEGSNTDGKAEIKLSCTTGTNCQGGWKIEPITGETVSVLHSVKRDEDGNLKDIVAYVDLDGFENNEISSMAADVDAIYLPYEIRLTFAEDVVVQEKSSVEVSTDLTEAQVKELTDAYGYTENKEKLTVTEETHATDNLPVFKYSGTIDEQVVNANSGYADLEAGFFGLVITPKTIIPNKTTVTIDKASNKGEGSKMITFKDNEPLVLLRQVTEDEEIKITVDIDGNEDAYLPYSFYINYEGVTVNKVSHVSVPNTMDAEVSKNLKSVFNFETPASQDVTVTYDADTKTIKVTGKVARNTEVKNMGENPSGYYVPFSLKFDKKYENITIQMPGNNTVSTYQNFDTETEIGAFLAVHPEKTDKTAKITVDLDGNGNVYEPFEITFDYSGVQFVAELDAKLDDATLESLKSFVDGFKGNNEDFAIEGTKLTGSVTKSETYFNGKDNEQVQGYFIGFVLHIPGLTQESKVTVGNTTMEPYDTTDDKDPGYAIVFQLKEEGPKTFTITIDLDGDGKEPTVYTYDYSDLQFKTEQTVANFASTSTTTPNASYSISETGQISGVVREAADDNKYHFNVTIAPQNVSEKTVVEVTDPKNNVTTYSYQDGVFVANSAMNVRKVSRRRSQLLTISNPTLTLDLEALVDVENRVYKVTIDADGDGELYDPITYDIDYSKLKLGDVEKVTEDVKKTADLHKVKLVSNSSTNALDRYTRYYDKDANKRWSVWKSGEESYTYSLVGAPYIAYKDYNALDRSMQSRYYVDNFHKVNKDASWEYNATLYSGVGIPGLSLLNNVTTVVSAKETPADAPEGYVYYDVIIDKDTVNEWLKNNYGSTPENVRTVDKEQTVHIAVDTNGVIRSIKANWTEDNGETRDINVEITDMANENIDWPDTGHDNDYWLNVWAEKHLGLNSFKTVEEAVAYRKAYWSQD